MIDRINWREANEARAEHRKKANMKAATIELAAEEVLNLMHGRPADPVLLEKALEFLEEMAENARSFG